MSGGGSRRSRTLVGILTLLGLPVLGLAIGTALMPFLFWPAVLLVSTVFFPGHPPAPGHGDGEDDGGGGGGPEAPRQPKPPTGGLPLPDAEPARVRLRDQHRPPLTPARQRRPAREPQRSPARTP